MNDHPNSSLWVGQREMNLDCIFVLPVTGSRYQCQGYDLFQVLQKLGKIAPNRSTEGTLLGKLDGVRVTVRDVALIVNVEGYKTECPAEVHFDVFAQKNEAWKKFIFLNWLFNFRQNLFFDIYSSITSKNNRRYIGRMREILSYLHIPKTTSMFYMCEAFIVK